MVDKSSNIDYEIITKYLAGEASAEEVNSIKSWLNASESNRATLVQLKKLWEQTGKIIPQEAAPVDIDSAWEKFKGRIDAEDTPIRTLEKPKIKTKSLLYYFSRVAAVLVIGVVFYLVYQSRSSATIEARELISSSKVITDTLSDGSIISLNAYSQISFPDKFNDKRAVALNGEAFFQVTHNPKKPFVVKVKGVKIVVLGTSFNVKAYDSLSTVEIGVERGKVKVVTARSETVLKAGESASVNKEVQKISGTEEFNANVLYWKSKTLVFQGAELATVFEALEKYYKVNITVGNKEILDCKLTAKFHEEDIQQIFEIISTNFNLTSQHEDNRFIVSGDGCS